jgi:hypothetical protein
MSFREMRSLALREDDSRTMVLGKAVEGRHIKSLKILSRYFKLVRPKTHLHVRDHNSSMLPSLRQDYNKRCSVPYHGLINSGAESLPHLHSSTGGFHLYFYHRFIYHYHIVITITDSDG